MAGCLDTLVHVHACSCACWAACLTCWWPHSRRKLLCWGVARTRGHSLPLLPTLSSLPLLVLRPQGCRRNTVSRRGLWALSGRRSLAGLWREEKFCSWPVASPSPFLAHHVLAAASWALNRKQGCRACNGVGGGGWGSNRGGGLDLPTTLCCHQGTLVPKVFCVSGPSVPKLRL